LGGPFWWCFQLFVFDQLGFFSRIKNFVLTPRWPDFGALLKRIYGDKVVADSEAVISYARGDW